MRSNAPLFGILAAVWILAGTWLFSTLICGSSAVSSAIPTFNMEDGLFKTHSPETFYFSVNSAAPNTDAKGLKESFAKIGTYINANETKQLSLVGLYDKDEINSTDYENLGIGRAESLKKLLTAVHNLDADKIITSGIDNDSLTYINERLYNGVTFSFVEPTENSGDSDFSSDEGLDMTPEVWTFSGATPNMEMTPDMQHYFDKLRAFLNANPQSVIEVVGHVAKSGSRSSDESLSLRKAAKVRRFFRNNGFQSAEVVAIGNGAESPVVDSDDPSADQENNRVEIRMRIAE